MRTGVCHICGEIALGNQGLPIFEEFIVPHTWTEEWMGVDACHHCFAKYKDVTEPTVPTENRGEIACPS